MKNRLKQPPLEEVLAGVTKSLEHYILHIMKEDLTLEEFAIRYPYFCLSNNHYLNFSPKPTFTGTGIESIAPYKIYSNGDCMFWNISISTYKRMLPDILFRKTKLGEWETPWYDSKHFFVLLPNRKKLIDEILKDL